MVAALYDKLKSLQVKVGVSEGQLNLQAPKGVLTAALMEEIKAQKPELIELINSYRGLQKTFVDIPTVAIQSDYPLSSSQYRLWVVSQLEAGNVAYNSPGIFIFEGKLDEVALEAALQRVIARHESLRTVFREINQGEVRQFILAPEAFRFSIHQQDLRAQADTEAALQQCLHADATRPFVLSEGPLFRVGLYRMSETQWVFSYVIHHITIDAWSMTIFINELLQTYNALVQQQEPDLPALRVQYKDYVAWQETQIQSERYARHRAYWMQQFAGTLPVLELPMDRPRAALQTFNGATYDKQIDAGISNAIKKILQEEGATLFAGLLAVVNGLLYRYSGQEDLITGTPIAGRGHADLEGLIGYFGNTLALRVRFDGQQGFRQLLQKTKQVVLEAFDHQEYPFDVLVEDLQLPRDMSRNPLFDLQVIVGQSAIKGSQQGLGDMVVRSYEQDLHTSRFEMVLHFTDTEEGLRLNVQYNSDIYSKAMVVRLSDNLEQWMKAIAIAPEKPLQELAYLPSHEQQQLLHTFNNNTLAYDRQQTILDLFAAQVSQYPEATAIRFEDVTLSYRTLDEKSSQVAHALREENDVQPGDLVGVMLDRSEKLMIAILGIQKAGAAYVPIDPEYPRHRKEYMVRDSGIRALVTQTDYLFDMPDYDGSIFAADLRLDMLETPVTVPLQVLPSQRAYMIYTSGSTGQPKGVLISHANLMHSTVARIDTYGHVRAFLLLSSVSFDSSVAGIFGTLCAGGELVITRKTDMGNVSLIADTIVSQHISHLLTIPSYYKLLIEELTDRSHSLEAVIVAGEACTPALVKAHFDTPGLQHCALYNEYGPTECSVWSTVYQYILSQPAVNTIGAPIANTQVYILDNRLQLLPIGVTGEICIGGAGLSEGYWKQPEKTAEKFVPHPFAQSEYLYKTGDLGKWLEDGNIVFLGRKDDQVKIRGYRIELGEVESALQGYPGMRQAVVVARDLGAGLEMLAYIAGDRPYQIPELQNHLSNVLPVHAMPSYFIQLEQLPLAPNGKVDRQRLPDPDGNTLGSGVDYKAPDTDAAQQLVVVLEEVLRKQLIGMNDDFFMLGGDSIKSIQVVSRLKQRGYSLSVQDVLLYPVIGMLATKLKPLTRTADQETVTGPVPLGAIQQWFFSLPLSERHHFNQSVLLESATRLSKKAVKAALYKLMLHHDALRLVFHDTPNGWVQENRGEDLLAGWEIITYATEEECTAHCERLQASFSLTDGPLFKAALLQGPDVDRLLLVAHHLVVDGVSWRILLEDLSALYHQYKLGVSLALPAKTDGFRYWQQQLSEYTQQPAIGEERAYWNTVIGTVADALPPDHPDGTNLLADSKVMSFKLDTAQTQVLLTQTYHAYRAEVNDILITSLVLALRNQFGMHTLRLQLEGHGREAIAGDADVSRTVGWFTSIYPVLVSLQESDDEISTLITVKETLHRVPHKGIGYGLLQYGQQGLPAAQPDITFNYLGDFGAGVPAESAFTFSAATKGAEMPERMQRTALLDVMGLIAGGQLQLNIVYSQRQFDEITITALVQDWQEQLLSIINRLSMEKQTYLTPVDLTYKDLSIEQLQQLNEML